MEGRDTFVFYVCIMIYCYDFLQRSMKVLCRRVKVNFFHVGNIIDNNRSISILKKQGETVEIESSDENKESHTGCQEAFDHDDRYTNDEIQEFVQEYHSNRIDYVKVVSCTNGSIQKRACYFRCIYRIIWRRINGRWYY